MNKDISSDCINKLPLQNQIDYYKFKCEMLQVDVSRLDGLLTIFKEAEDKHWREALKDYKKSCQDTIRSMKQLAV